MPQLNSGGDLLAIVCARIGDTLLATPALRALAAANPDARLTVMAHPNRLELLRHLPFVHRLEAMTPRRAAWAGRLFPKRYAAAMVFGHDASLIRYALRVADRVVAFRQNDADLDDRLAAAVAPTAGGEHAVLERLRLAEALGATPAGRQLAYVVTAAEAEEAKRFVVNLFAVPCSSPFKGEAGRGMGEIPIPADDPHSALSPHPHPNPPLEGEGEDAHATGSAVPGAPLVGMQLRSFPTKAYRDWSQERFAALIERLLAAYPEARVVLLGGPESSGDADAMAARFDSRVAVAAGKLDLRANAALMSQLDAYVGVDTGPTHLAGALGVPMVALYHCRHRGAHLAPLDHPRLRVIEHPAMDADCSNTRSMDEIAVDTVWRALSELLSEGKA